MKHRLFFSVILASGLTSQAFAGTMGPVMIDNWAWFGSLSGGPVWASSGETQDFYLTPDIEKTYVARKSSNALVSGEVFVGMQKSLPYQGWSGQLGLAVATTSNAKLQGVIWDDADFEFENHSYHYKIRNTRIAAKGQLLLDKGYWLTPYVNASLGVGFNNAHNFRNIPLIFEALPNPNFSNYTKTAFTYTLGAGVQKAIDDHWRVGVGYEFADWGRSELGRAFDQTLNTGLKLNHLYTNGVLFNFTYVA